jgi:hypothetical protein
VKCVQKLFIGVLIVFILLQVGMVVSNAAFIEYGDYKLDGCGIDNPTYYIIREYTGTGGGYSAA